MSFKSYDGLFHRLLIPVEIILNQNTESVKGVWIGFTYMEYFSVFTFILVYFFLTDLYLPKF